MNTLKKISALLLFILCTASIAYANETPMPEISEDEKIEAVEEIITPPEASPEPSHEPEMPQTTVDTYIFDTHIDMPNIPIIENDNLLVPIKFFMENVTSIEYTQTEEGNVTISGEGKTVEMGVSCNTAYLGKSPITLSVAPKIIDGVFYAPMRFICEYFGFAVEALKAEDTLTVNVYTKSMQNEKFVNSLNLTSDTPYLIWVSKANYTVHVFLESENGWREVYTCPCAIGAVKTPTITGTFKFYSLEKAWKYANYYVGPIMRFRGGYAIHSTLVRYDGTDYDATVNAKISHGCVRVRPANLSWLVSYVPLNTTIHITEN